MSEFHRLTPNPMDKPVQKIGGWLLAAALIALAVWNQNRTAREDAKAVATATQAASRSGEAGSSEATGSATGDGSARKTWRPVNGGYNTGPVIGQRTPVPQPMSAKAPTPVQLAKAATPSPATPALQPDPKKAPFVPVGAKTNLDEGRLQPSKGIEVRHKK